MQKSNDRKLLYFGRLGRPFGLKGWSHVYPVSEKQDTLIQIKWWTLKNTASSETFGLDLARIHNNHLVCHLHGIDHIDIAKLWTNADILIDRAHLPALNDNQFYWEDCLELTVLDLQQQVRGKITAVDWYPGSDHPVLSVLAGDGKKYLILGLMDEVIKTIYWEEQRMMIDWDW